MRLKPTLMETEEEILKRRKRLYQTVIRNAPPDYDSQWCHDAIGRIDKELLMIKWRKQYEFPAK